MVNFGEYLSDFLQKHNLTISSVASKAKIDRTLLSKAISGSRSLNRTTFKKLVSAIEPTYHEMETLTELYAISYFGEDNYNRIQLIIKNHESKNSNSPDSAIKSGDKQFYRKNEKNYGLLTNTADVHNRIRYALTNEFSRENPTLYSNFPYNSEYINKILLSLLENSDREIDFRHIVCFSRDDNGGDELRATVQAEKYQLNGYATKYYIGGEACGIDLIFPYYIILSEELILFESDLRQALSVGERDIIDLYRDIFNKTAQQCCDIVSSVNSITDFRETLLPYCTNTYELMYFGNILNFFITEDTLGLIQFDRGDNELSAYMYDLCDINAHILTDFNFYNIIMYKNEISEFIRDGVINLPARNETVTVPDENKWKFLSLIFDFIKKKNVFFCITNSKSDSFTSDSSIMVCSSEIYKDNIALTYRPTRKNGGSAHGYVVVNNDITINTYCNFFEYLNLFSYTESQESSVHFLSKQISYAKKLAAEIPK